MRPSGPMEVEFEEFAIASRTMRELKGVKDGSKGCWEWILRMRSRVEGLDLWRKWEVNCLAKALEMDFDLVKFLLRKDTGWLGGTGEVLPDKDLMTEKSLEELKQWSALEKVASHHWRLYLEVEDVIWELRMEIWGLQESVCRRASRSLMSAATLGGD